MNSPATTTTEVSLVPPSPSVSPVESQNGTDTQPAPSAPGRCEFRYPSRNRCRKPVGRYCAPYCEQHGDFPPEERDTINIAPALLGDITTIDDTHDAQIILGRLFILLAQNRISPRKAAVLSYILQQFLRNLYVMKKEEESDTETFFSNAPRPQRD